MDDRRGFGAFLRSRRSGPLRHLLSSTLSMAAGLGLAFAALPAGAAPDAAATFEARCSTCHSVGHGVVVGPDLQGVTARHAPAWLHAFVRSSQTVIRSGDASATALFKKYQRVMPDHPLSDGEIDALLAYIEAGAPPARAAAEVREAATATPAEVALGRDLFQGKVALARGGAACAHCHTAGNAERFGGGSLASDLDGVYRRYQDWELHQALRHADFPLMRRVYGARPLTEGEVFAIKAYLRQAPDEARGSSPLPSSLVAFLGAGSAALVLVRPRRGQRSGAPAGRR